MTGSQGSRPVYADHDYEQYEHVCLAITMLDCDIPMVVGLCNHHHPHDHHVIIISQRPVPARLRHIVGCGEVV